MIPVGEDHPRSMRDPTVRARRIAELGNPRVVNLTKFVRELREHSPVWRTTSSVWEVPDFDPADGGVTAQVLFLFEKPGPMTAKEGRRKRQGSGFISRDNDDPTAAAIFRFMRRAKLPRERTVLWNLIPWWNGTRDVSGPELKDGLDRVKDLIDLLPNLRAIMLVGTNAAKARPQLELATKLCLLGSSHPSPLVRARWPERWEAIPSEWERVATCIALNATGCALGGGWHSSGSKAEEPPQKV
jgi:hypothetical protein